jgi:hypothetical protein
MKWPPYLLKMRFRNPDRSYAFWLPLFLVWPLVLVFLLAIFIVLVPFALLAMIFSWQSDWISSVVMCVPALYRLFSQLAGLVVDVEGNQGHFRVEFI